MVYGLHVHIQNRRMKSLAIVLSKMGRGMPGEMLGMI
jgi:hypothetical protein